MVAEGKALWRFASGLRRFLRSRLSPEESRRIVEQSVRDREKNFLALMRRGVYGFPQSPYLALLRWAGVEYGDLEGMVLKSGLEASKHRLLEAGVFVELEEFKGRRTIKRPGLELAVKDTDFDNPLFEADYHVESSGSTGARRRMKIDFDLLVYDSAFRSFAYSANGVESRPRAAWRGILPDSSGLKQSLLAAKAGAPMERWFSPIEMSWLGRSSGFTMLTAYAVLGGRWMGAAMPWPEFVPLSDPSPIARWLAEKVRAGTPALLTVSANNAVRVCSSAKEWKLDIAGTAFRTGGEPLTAAKSALIQEMGVRTISGWSMAEVGPIAAGCAAREAIDEVHLFLGKIAAIQKAKLMADGETQVDAIYLSTVLTSSPKIMLNVDTGDFGVMNQRQCGCPLELAGLTRHLHTIRNYEKLTAGGIHFLGDDIIRLVEEVLPSRFGGNFNDYQFVEEQDGALSYVSIVVSPKVGVLLESDVIETVLSYLSGQSSGGRVMSKFWDQGRTLRVSRRNPYVTSSFKTPPLRVMAK